MRNLKRVLSLALASAMLLGMMVMGAGAADTKKPLTDLDKVVNKDAVNLMVDLAVITGKPDGSYAPAETVDRATMATLIYKIMTGETNADAFKGASSLADVKGTWAEGFINYCSSMKIVNGDGTNFYPTNKVTVVAAAKMLLVSIGYDADLSKYTNDSMWSVNIMRDAKKAGILDEIGQNANEELTRDNAAQMISNTLFADIVKPVIDRDQGVAYLTKYEAIGSTLASDTYKLVKVTGNVSDVVDGKAEFTTVTPDFSNKMVQAINKAGITAGADMKGKNATIYVKGSVSYNTDGSAKSVTVDKVYSTVLSSGATNVLGTSMNGTAYSKLIDKAEKKTFIAEEEDEATVTYYENGADSTKAKVETASAKKGVIVELIDTDGNNLVDLVKVTAKEAKKVTGDVATRTYKDEFQVSVPGVCGYTDATKVNGYEGLVEDDYVLTYKDKDGNVYIELADTVTGKIAGKKSTYEIKVDGTYYGWSGLVNSKTIADVTTDNVLDTKNEYLFVLDNNGTISKLEKTTDENTGKTAIALASAWVTGGGIGATKYLEVQLLLADGTTEIVTVAKLDGEKVSKDHNTVTDNAFYDYTVDSDGKYNLKATDPATVSKVGAGKIENGKVGVNVSGVSANSKTVYLVQKGNADDGYTYSSYTGYANVPTMNIADTSASKLVKDGKVAKYVFLTAEKFVGDTETANYVYLIDPSSYSYVAEDGDVPEHYDYDVIMDGVKDKLSFDTVLDTHTIVTGLYNVGEIVDGIASADSLDDQEIKDYADGDAIGDGIVSVADISDTVYTYDADTNIYVIELTADEKGKITDADVMNATTGSDFSFSAEEGYTYGVVVSPAKEGSELLGALYIFQVAVPDEA